MIVYELTIGYLNYEMINNNNSNGNVLLCDSYVSSIAILPSSLCLVSYMPDAETTNLELMVLPFLLIAYFSQFLCFVGKSNHCLNQAQVITSILCAMICACPMSSKRKLLKYWMILRCLTFIINLLSYIRDISGKNTIKDGATN